MVEVAAQPIAERRPPLAGHRFANAGVTLTPAEPTGRTVVRGDAAAAGEALGLDLPTKVGRSSEKDGATAMTLGPDEWLVVGGEAVNRDADAFVTVDVSHRNTAVVVAGDGAAATLNAGCPRDLSETAFPVGACARTVLGKAEIVLLRTAPDAFRVEFWRSFSPYVWAFLEDAAADSQL